MYGVVTIIALVIFYVFIPETKDYSIEEIELLFMNKRKLTMAMAEQKMNKIKSNREINEQTDAV